MILTTLEKIAQYTQGFSFEQFRAGSKTVDAVVRNLEVIGEAARQVPKDFAAEYPEIPWAKMVGLRNKILHEYFGVDVEILWQTIREDFPPLKTQVKKASESPG